MSANRPFSWNSALRSLKADRQAVPAGFVSARSLATCFARTRGALVVAGQYDRRAIMTVAVMVAKQHQLRTGASWADSISLALKATWQAAKLARQSSRH